MLAALAANALLAALMGLTADLSYFLVIRLVAGLASAFLMVFLAAIVFSHLAGAGRNDLQAVHFSGVGLGIAVSGLMTGALVLAGRHGPRAGSGRASCPASASSPSCF